MLFTDTDSLVYEVETNGVYKEFYEYTNFFDFSDYKKDSKFFDPVNKKLLAKWKMNSRKKTTEFVGLDSNMCSLIALDNKENNKKKGVKKMLLKK